MARLFSLDEIREGVGKRTAELNEEAEPRSVEDDFPERGGPISYEHSDYDRTEAPKDDMRTYWRQFETTPIVRKPVTSFASRVTEPGYYIEAQTLERDEIRELGSWLDKCAIVGGMPGKNFRLLARKAIIQREIRGTALVEKAPHMNDSDKIAGLKLINPEVCEAVTRPQQSILVSPDDGERYPDAPAAESEGKAAWLQDVVEAREVDWGVSSRIRGNEDKGDDLKIGFRRDEIIPLTRDEDVGEVFGTSRLEAVSDRIEGLKQKLDDNDKAIESKAYPLWLFLFGDPETTGVWDTSDIDDFMNSHEMDNFHPGMKQGVRGDVDVETISGEVSDIAEYLNFDIKWIMASMPLPLLALGSFGDIGGGVGRVAGVAQQQDVNRQIKEARRELEEEFSPLIREIAQQKGINEERAQDIRLRIGDPSRPDEETERSEQTIRYISNANGGETKEVDNQMGRTPTSPQQAPRTQDGNPANPESANGQNGGEEDSVIPGITTSFSKVDEVSEIDSAAAAVWDEDISAAHLSNDDRQTRKLSETVERILTTVRDDTLNTIGSDYENAPQFAAVEFENVANKNLNNTIRSANLRKSARESFDDVVRGVAREYGNEVRLSRTQNVRFYTQTFENAVRDAAEEMLRRARVLVRDGIASGERWSDVRERVEDRYSDGELRNRANLIAHMELTRARETTKLQQFEADPNIVGVRVHNPDASARVTEQLDGAEAYFDNGEVDDQLSEQVSDIVLRKGFDPLPRTPPYHFNDTTTLEPIYNDS
jgi:hypothetical protein